MPILAAALRSRDTRRKPAEQTVDDI